MKVDIKEYISSGILEAYVLGTLTNTEREEVETVAAQYSEIKDEIKAIEEALNKYAELHSVKPDEKLKQWVLDSVTDDDDKKARIRKMNFEEEERRDPRNKMVWSVAASVLLMISVTLNIYLYTQRTIKAEGYLQQLSVKFHEKDSMLNLLTVQYDQAQEDMKVLKDPMYKIVELKGQGTDSSAKAMVCWCPGSKLVYFEADKMPSPPKGKQYQLWAIVDGKPINEGMITMNTGLHKMKDISQATAFAVTLEQEGGSDTPHGDMIVMGNI